MSNLYPVVFMDAPEILDASVTPIPGSGSSPLQVIADTDKNVIHSIEYVDSTGDYIGVYTGGIGSEILKCIIGGGVVNRIDVVIPASSRVSLRSMTASSITNGKLSMILMGYKKI